MPGTGNVSPDIFLDPTQRNVEPRQGQIGGLRAIAQPGSLDEENRRLRFICSTNSVDRYGEIVEPEAFRGSLERFRQNPVFPAGHVYIGSDGEPTTIGKWVQVEITQDGLEGVAEFMADDPLAERYWQRYRQGYMNAVSVGFIVHAWEMREVEVNGRTERVRVFTDVELVEISAVAIPANRDSLVRAASALNAAGASQSAGEGGQQINIEELSKAIEPAVERALSKRLDTSPGSPLLPLVQDVVELAYSRAGFSVADGYDVHSGGEPDRTEAAGGDEQELKHMLRGMVGQGSDDAGGDE